MTYFPLPLHYKDTNKELHDNSLYRFRKPSKQCRFSFNEAKLRGSMAAISGHPAVGQCPTRHPRKRAKKCQGA